MNKMVTISSVLLCMTIQNPSLARGSETTYELISRCAAGANFDISGDFQGSLEGLFEGEGLQGTAAASIVTKLYELFPSEDRLEVAKMYYNCVAKKEDEEKCDNNKKHVLNAGDEKCCKNGGQLFGRHQTMNDRISYGEDPTATFQGLTEVTVLSPHANIGGFNYVRIRANDVTVTNKGGLAGFRLDDHLILRCN